MLVEAYAYFRGCKKLDPTSARVPCSNGCQKDSTTGRIECICNKRMCNFGESWTIPCEGGPDVAALHASLGAVIIVDMMLMFSSFIIALLL